MGLLERAAQRLLEGMRLRVRPNVTSTDQGGQRSKALNSGLEFADHREYVPGDDVRQIDWKAFARHKTLTVRTFEEERDVRIYALVDVSPSMTRGTPPKLEVARRLAAAFGYLGMKQFDRVQVVPFAGDLVAAGKVMRSRSDYPLLEKFLNELSPQGVTSFGQTARAFAQRFPSRGYVVVLTDLMDATDWAEPLRFLARAGHQLSLVRLACREDDEPDFRGEVELHDAETGQRLRLAMSRTLLNAYRAEIAEHVTRCREAVVRAGGHFAEARVERPTEDLLRTVMARETQLA